MNQFKRVIITIIIMAILAGFNSCYYDKEELLYPDTACDTAAVKYSTTIIPVIATYCYACHAGNTPSSGIKLDNYLTIQAMAANGKLWGSISHSPGFSRMPKDGNKLTPCNIAKIKIWIEAGYPNN